MPVTPPPGGPDSSDSQSQLVFEKDRRVTHPAVLFSPDLEGNNPMHQLLTSRGRCIDSDSHELFFSDRPSELTQAQAICSGCDVQTQCLSQALETGVEWGVWGGVIFWDGEAMFRKRGRGRPRKNDTLVFEVDRLDLLEMARKSA